MAVYRSFLFAPGNHARRVEKSLTLGADAVILDLEDAVANAEKADARALVVQALSRPRACRGYVRVNSLGTPWSHADFVSVVTRGVDGIVLPKVESAADLQIGEWLIASLEREHGLPEGSIDLIPLIETASGYCNIADITRAATRVRRFAFGAGDFTLDLGITWSADEAELLPFRSNMIAQARAAGLEPPIDTVWVSLADTEGFERSVKRAKDLGFQGKLCIPDQVPVVNGCFRPTDQELVHARRVVAAFAQAEREGLAAIQVDGQFVDYPIVYRAQRLIERDEAISRAEQPR